MSRPAHVGECPVMVWIMVDDGGPPVLCQEWERFAVIDQRFLADAEPPMLERWWDDEDPIFRSRVTIRCQNGWATYRLVGDDDRKQWSVWELIVGEYEPYQGSVDAESEAEQTTGAPGRD